MTVEYRFHIEYWGNVKDINYYSDYHIKETMVSKQFEEDHDVLLFEYLVDF